jgi:DNA-binding transcriptional MerR regulator
MPARTRLYSVGEISVATGLSRQTLHQYALLGLIRPSETTPSGRRLYPVRVVRRLDEIRALKADHTLAQIRDLLTGPRGRAR